MQIDSICKISKSKVHFTDKIIERWAYQDMHGKDYIPGELDIEILGTKDDDM